MVWNDIPTVLLREHYRCHPKIAGFCNQKFYQNQLIIMTEDNGEEDALILYRTAEGNHARGHLNQWQIDTICQEIIPRLISKGYTDIGVITPYRDQVAALRDQLPGSFEIDTVHKFQGREKAAVILTTVDNVISDFVDDPHLLNVAVSRAIKSLCVVISTDDRNMDTNLGDLVRYIQYNNFETIDSTVYSVFDLLYKGYAEKRREFLKKHRRVSEWESENLMYAVIETVLQQEPFQKVDCAVRVMLNSLIKDYNTLTEEERVYARNPLTHVDFLLFNRMNKLPVLAIEVDGYGFHRAGTLQAERDALKDNILDKCKLPLLRFKTIECGEKERLSKRLAELV